MSTIAFDTLRFANTLKAAGIPDQQAEAEARALVGAIGEIDVATQRDVDDLRKETYAMELRLTVKPGAFLTLAVGVIIAVLRLPM